MNILFMTLLDFDSIQEKNIYTDLLREFVKNGHNVYAISPVEKRKNQNTHIIKEENVFVLKLKIGNLQKTNIIEKGISTVTIESRFISGIKKYLGDVKFDLVLYSTPPITLCDAIAFVKKRDEAQTYLLLKDIFPQNAVDMGMLSKNGVKGILYRYFRRKEKKLYALSDCIGCMSPANVEYVLKHNPELDYRKVRLSPNCVEVIDKSVDVETKRFIRRKYNLPLEKKIFVYGGNLGKPQGIPFLIECLRSQAENEKAFFLIVGDGTEYSKLNDFVVHDKPCNVKLMQRIPKDDYDTLVGACDVGMIFLDHRFTIPNFPSRLLSYMQAKIPILAATDPNTDVGKVIVEGGFGWWCESNDVRQFSLCIEGALNHPDVRELEFEYLRNEYSSVKSYESIIN